MQCVKADFVNQSVCLIEKDHNCRSAFCLFLSNRYICWCKFICHGRNRQEAIQRMNRSLDEFVIEGITTTIQLHKKLLNHEKFINSDFNVSWLDKEKII